MSQNLCSSAESLPSSDICKGCALHFPIRALCVLAVEFTKIKNMANIFQRKVLAAINSKGRGLEPQWVKDAKKYFHLSTLPNGNEFYF